MIRVHTVKTIVGEWKVGYKPNLDEIRDHGMTRELEFKVGDLRAMMNELDSFEISDDVKLEYVAPNMGWVGKFRFSHTSKETNGKPDDQAFISGGEPRREYREDKPPLVKTLSQKKDELVYFASGGSGSTEKAKTINLGDIVDKFEEINKLETDADAAVREVNNLRAAYQKSPGIESCQALVEYYSLRLKEALKKADIELAGTYILPMQEWLAEAKRFSKTSS